MYTNYILLYFEDTTTQKTLLLTYRSMITPEELLDLLKLRFSMPLPDGNPISVESFKTQKQKPIQVRYEIFNFLYNKFKYISIIILRK